LPDFAFGAGRLAFVGETFFAGAFLGEAFFTGAFLAGAGFDVGLGGGFGSARGTALGWTGCGLAG
jgi:hypothetical protein